MIKVLHITSSHKGKNSITNKLGKAIINKIQQKRTDEVIVEDLDLLKNPFPHFNLRLWEGYHAPAHKLTPEQALAAYRSDESIAQLLASDIVVISVPMHNYGIPSALKAYLDHIVRAGVTFGFTETGHVGLFKNKKAYIAFSAGWDFSQPALKPYDFVSPYLKVVLQLIGFEVVDEYRVEGESSPQAKEKRLSEVIRTMKV